MSLPRRLSLPALLGAGALALAATGPTAAAAPSAGPSVVSLWATDVPPLATAGGVSISGEGFGSALAPVPGRPGQVYGLTDRGPNVDGPDDTKIEPLPDFTPMIGRFVLQPNGVARLVQRIPLRAPDGTPYDGRVSTVASTGETITDLDGTVLAPSPTGYDPEGLVALRDGTFWVSDEYGPFITHFSRSGRQLARLSPYDGTLPAELAERGVNRGMEGLTVTPDGSTLVGIMQSALDRPDLTVGFKKVPLVRIVTVSLRTGATHEYAYLLHDPADNGTAVSEIAALSATRFLVLERDGAFEPGAFKRVYAVDLTGAIDIEDRTDGDTSLEQAVGAVSTADATTTLAGLRITPVTSSLAVDLGGLVTALDPSGGFFGHDKLEGLAVVDHGRRLLVSNDNDFGIDGIVDDTPPYQLGVKTLPDGRQDDGEILSVPLP